jgi:hypothetical protein
MLSAARRRLAIIHGNPMSLTLGYDVLPDGRFIMLKPVGGEVQPNEIHIVQNLFDELRRRVPLPN